MVDLARGGLYTQEEVRAWEELLAFPTYHSALLRSFSLGTCIAENLCDQVAGQPAYNLRNMMDEQLKWTDPWEVLQHSVERWGGMCSMLMLGYLVVRTLVDLVLVSLTAIWDGPAMVLALLVELYASSTLTYQRIRRRQRRAQQCQLRESALSSAEGLCLTRIQPQGGEALSEYNIQSE